MPPPADAACRRERRPARRCRGVAAILVPLVLAASAGAAENGAARAPDHARTRRDAALVRRALALQLPPVTELGPAAVEAKAALDELARWNQRGARPRREGIVRALGRGHTLSVRGETLLGLTQEQRSGASLLTPHGDEIVWTFGVRVRQAPRLRVRLAAVALPPGAETYAYGSDGTARGPAPVVPGDDGVVWTPSVDGGAAWIEVHLPKAQIAAGARYGFTVDAVLESVRPQAGGAGAGLPACLVDFACTSSIPAALAPLRSAVGQLTFVDGPFSYVCSGGLLNDRDESSFIPYLLTAHHCFDTQASASSLEVLWDLESTSCGGPPSASGTTYGAQLLATSAVSDFTFVRLSQDPPGSRYFLGWTTAAPSGTLTRFHHPGGGVVYVSQHTVSPNAGTCAGVPDADFLYTDVVLGATAGGSSGAPLLDADGRVVGQLLGACGPNPDDSCDTRNRDTDGRFARTYPSIAAWIDAGGSPTTTLVGSTTTTTLPPDCTVVPCPDDFPYCGPDGNCWLLPCDTLCGAGNCCGGDHPECAGDDLCYAAFGCPPHDPFPFDTDCAVCAGQPLPRKVHALFGRAAAKALRGRARSARKRLDRADRKLEKAWRKSRIDEPCYRAVQRAIATALDALP